MEIDKISNPIIFWQQLLPYQVEVFLTIDAILLQCMIQPDLIVSVELLICKSILFYLRYLTSCKTERGKYKIYLKHSACLIISERWLNAIKLTGSGSGLQSLPESKPWLGSTPDRGTLNSRLLTPNCTRWFLKTLVISSHQSLPFSITVSPSQPLHIRPPGLLIIIRLFLRVIN